MNDQEKAFEKTKAMNKIKEGVESLKQLEPKANIFLHSEHGSYSLMGKILFMFQSKD